MSKADLFAELRAAVDNVRAVHPGQLVRMGVGWDTIDGLTEWGDIPFGIATGEASAGLFEPGDGQPHIVMPVVDGGVLVDLVAWRSSDPARWSRRTGDGWALGTSDISRATDDPTQTIAVWATPLDWLRAAARGVCVLDWLAPEVPLLRNVRQIKAQTSEVAAFLRNALTRHLDLPSISIMEAQRHAA